METQACAGAAEKVEEGDDKDPGSASEGAKVTAADGVEVEAGRISTETAAPAAGKRKRDDAAVGEIAAAALAPAAPPAGAFGG